MGLDRPTSFELGTGPFIEGAGVVIFNLGLICLVGLPWSPWSLLTLLSGASLWYLGYRHGEVTRREERAYTARLH